MWHDTMLVGCRPVCDFSNSCIILKTQTVWSLKLSCSSRPKLKLLRPRAVPSIVHGDSGSSKGSLDWRREEEVGLLHNQYGTSSLVPCKSRIRGLPYNWRSFALKFKIRSVLAQESRPVVTVCGSTNSSLAMSLSAVAMMKDVEISGLAKGEMGMQVHSTREQEKSLCEGERLRRHRISLANKGKVPWNKGCKHSAETIKRIKERTSQAMQSPTVLAKLRLSARHSQTDETKRKIRNKLRVKWGTKKKIRGYQDEMLKDWRECVADAARRGCNGEEEMQWNSYSIIKKNLRMDAANLARAEKVKIRIKMKSRRPSKSDEHRQKISAAIKAKWESPEYKLKVREGMIKSNDSQKKNSQRRKSSGDSATSEAGVIKGPLDHGFVTAVMLGEKKRQQKEEAAKEKYDDRPSVSAAKTKLRARDRKVDLLKICTGPSGLVEEGLNNEESFIEEFSVSAEHSFVDPLANEKLFRLKLLQASRSEMDQKRREATHRAKVLMAEAERAARTLEAAAGNNESARASLAEIHRLMEEAEQFIQAADSVNEVVDSTKPHNGALWRKTMATHESSKSQLGMESNGNHGTLHRQQDDISSTDSKANHAHDLNQQSGQDIAVGMSSKSSIVCDSAQVMMFSGEMRDMALWDLHNACIEESTHKCRPPSAVGLLNGATSRRIGVIEETKSRALFERWQHARLVTVDDEIVG